MKKHIVLIAPHGTMIDCARLHNLDITIFDLSENVKNYEDLADVNAFFFNYLDIRLAKKILFAIHNFHFVNAIVTLTEEALGVATELALFLHLPALSSDTINFINDKNAMRKYLSNKSDFAIRYVQPTNRQELSFFANKISFPFIVKPVDGCGSKDVTKITTYDQIKTIDFSKKQIAEEFIKGDEYSVESFSFNGEHMIIAITRKMLIDNIPDGNNFTEMGHCVPANLTEQRKSLIHNYIKKFLTLIGIDNGPTHTEIKISGDTIRVIETHNRIGGNQISTLVKISTGIDLVELSILWPLGLVSPILKEPSINCHAAICFFNPPCGKLLSVSGTEMLKYSPGVIETKITCKPGDEIMPFKDSFNRYGYVITTGKNETDAINNSKKASEKIVFKTSA